MKPAKLRISAFGPFADLIDIDFTRFERDGLFLLSGETGAGKTTIFDAISFALFGKVSGETRGTSNLRSDFAKPDTPTYVSLDFEHKGVMYSIRRSPEYTRPKAKGEGETVSVASVEFHMPGQTSPLTRTRAVDAAVEELLSVTYEQFKQIMMIAQGEFVALITAESKDRTDIMRRVFGTGIFADVQSRLQKLAGEIKSTKDMISAEVMRLQSSFVSDIDTSDERLLELGKQRSALKTQLDALLVRIEQASSLNKSLMELSGNRSRKTEAEMKLLEAKTTLDRSLAGEQRRDQLKRMIQEIESALPKYIEHTAKSKKLKEKSSELARYNAEKGLLEEKIEKANKELAALKAEIDTLKSAQTDAIELKVALETAEERLRQIRSLKHSHERWISRNVVYMKVQKHYFTARKLYDDSVAGRLAGSLKDGEACPVCGSTLHPAKASAPKEAPKQEEFEKIERDYNIARDESSAAKAQCDSQSAELGISVDDLLSEIDKHTDAVETTLHKKQAADAAVARLTALIKLEKQLPAGIDADTQRVKSLESRISALATEAEVLKAEMAGLEKELVHGSEEAANSERTVLSAELAASSDALKKATEKHQALREMTASLAALEESGERNTKELSEKLNVPCEAVDLKEYDGQKASLELRSLELEQLEHSAKSAKAKNEQIADQLKQSRKRLEATERRYADIDLLYRTASGNLAGKGKLQFETYVQQVYFDMVLTEANKRFGTMTDGRYELLRQDHQKLQGKAGLDLDVFDSWSQRTRPAKTLSGGECFKAALSLALGLCDVVQSFSGGVKIDAMFIDEGFGSLDSDSLESVMEIIADLADGRRLVGIISHVEAMKEQIPNKILIERDKAGSRITQ